MSIRLSVDRFEGRTKETAVLVSDDGGTLHVPRSALPEGTQPGDVLTLSFERDVEATRRLADETKRLQAKLSERDPGGDIKL